MLQEDFLAESALQEDFAAESALQEDFAAESALQEDFAAETVLQKGFCGIWWLVGCWSFSISGKGYGKQMNECCYGCITRQKHCKNAGFIKKP